MSGVVIPKRGALILAQSAVAVPNTGGTTEVTLATITIPAGAMGPNGRLHIFSLWSATNNANSKTLRIRLGGIGGTAFLSVGPSSWASISDFRSICNRGAQNSQVSFSSNAGGLTSSTGAFTTGSIDTSATQSLVITGQLASGADTMTLEAYSVELLRP